MMYYQTNFGDPASNSIKDTLWTNFSLMFYKGKKVGHSDLIMVCDTAPSRGVLPHPSLVIL